MQKQPQTAFDLKAAMTEALDWLWTYKAAERKKLEAKGDTSDRWYAEHTYTTATELERRVRSALCERQNSAKVGAYGINGGIYSGFRIQGLGGISLLDHCRRFLLRSGLERHNFGRGHVSGERFRAPGVEIPESERKTLEAKAKTKPVHLKRASAWAPLCTEGRKSQRGTFSRHRSHRPSTSLTQEADKVTCPRCRKLMEAAAK